MKKAVIFDLDGTLWDSTETVLPAWNAALEAGDCVLTLERLRSLMGMTMAEIGSLLMPQLPSYRQIEIMQDCFAREQVLLRERGARLYPGLEETLEALSRNYSLFVVSNCQTGYIEAFLDHYRFDRYISDHECAGGTGLGKGGNIALIARRNGVDRALYVGDTQGDLDAADEAGIPFVWASYGFGSVAQPRPRIDSLSELPALADRLL